MTRSLAILVACAALLGASYAIGRSHGQNAANARHAAAVAALQTRLAAAAELASTKEAARLAIEAERNTIALELEHEARQDPYADRAALGADSVRRIDRR